MLILIFIKFISIVKVKRLAEIFKFDLQLFGYDYRHYYGKFLIKGCLINYVYRARMVYNSDIFPWSLPSLYFYYGESNIYTMTNSIKPSLNQWENCGTIGLAVYEILHSGLPVTLLYRII